jgi:hypothetical protein
MRVFAAILLLATPLHATRIKTVPKVRTQVGTGMTGLNATSLRLPENSLDISVPTLSGTVLPAASAPSQAVVPQKALGAAAGTSPIPGANSILPAASKADKQEGTPVPQVGSKALQAELERQGKGAANLKAGEQPNIDDAAALAAAMFDGMSIADPQSIKDVVREGTDRGGPYTVDGRPTEKIGGGQFKSLLAVPGDDAHLLALFDNVVPAYANRLTPKQLTEDITINSRSERSRELRLREPLVEHGLAPAHSKITRLHLHREGRSDVIAGYYVERVQGGEVWKLGAEDLRLVRELFDRLIEQRIFWGLEPDKTSPTGFDPKLTENIMVGTTKSQGRRQAWIVDAGSILEAPKYTRVDRLVGKVDPLRAHYTALYRELRRQHGASTQSRIDWQRAQAEVR